MNRTFYKKRLLTSARLRANVDLVSEPLFDKLNCSFNRTGLNSKSLWMRIGVGFDCGISLKQKGEI